jgi:Flp pilus assembly protein TadD
MKTFSIVLFLFVLNLKGLGQSALDFINQGNKKVEKGDFFAAKADFTKAIELSPKDAEAYYNRGFCMGELKEYSGAIADYSKATELNPEDARAFYNRDYYYDNCHPLHPP